MGFHFTAHVKVNGHRLLASTCLSAALLCGLPTSTSANPTGGVVAAGSATISSNGSKLNVNQQTNKAVIDWRGFDIDSGEQTQFYQPNANAIALNRVHSSQASQIDGDLTANGNVVIINQNGVMFGKTAKVDVNGLVATTADVDTTEFMTNNAPKFDKPGNPDASVVNEGTITAKQAGLVGLVAPNVSNSGVITAKLGRVQLASGETTTVDFYGDGLLEVAVSDNARSQLVSNTGHIQADGGMIAMTAAHGKNIVDSLITVKGTLEAKSLSGHAGSINVAGAKDKTEIDVAGALDASGKTAGLKGGSVHVTGNKIAVMNGSTIDASGAAGGGEILLGGDTHGGGTTPTASRLFVDHDTTLLANAISSGNGGKVILWSDNGTAFYGSINISGGAASGNGGFAEVSGRDWLGYAGTVDATALHGQTGTLLLDPADITISNAADSQISGSSPFTAVGVSPSNLNVTTLVNALNSANVMINSSSGSGGVGNITFADAVAWNSNKSLTVFAANNININNSITNSGTGDIILDAVIATTGDITINGALSTGGSITALASRDVNVNGNLTTGTTGGLDLEAAGGSASGVGNLNIAANLSVGSGIVTMISGANGTRPSWTMSTTNFIPQTGTVGNVNINGFNDLTIDRNLTSSGSITLKALRDLTLSATRTLSSVSLDLRAANGSTAGTGKLNLLGNLTLGTGALTLISGSNSGRPDWTLTTTSLSHGGSFTAGIDIEGFNDVTVNRALTMGATSSILFNNNNRVLSNSNMTTSGGAIITISSPFVIQEGSAVTLTTDQAIVFGGTIDGTAGGSSESLTLTAGTGTVTFGGALNGFGLTASAGTFAGSISLGQTTAMNGVSVTSVNALTLPDINSIGNVSVTTTGTNGDITAAGNVTSGSNITMTAFRNLTVNAGKTLTSGSTSGIALNAANGVVGNTGALTLNGALANGTGNLTLLSGTTRPNLTLDATNLTMLGASFGVISITGFQDITINRDLTSSAGIALTAYRDLTLNSGRTLTTGSGSTGAITLYAANAVTTGTGNLNINGNINVGSGNVIMRSGANGTRPSWTMTSSNFTTQSTFGGIDIQGFMDLAINRALTNSASMSFIVTRDLTLAVGSTLTTGTTGGLILEAANNVVTGTGNLTLNGNALSVGTGALTMTSGVNGTRPSWTIDSSSLIRQGATFGAITISGFLNTVVDRDLNSTGVISINSFQDLTLNATRTLTPGAAAGLSLLAANNTTTGTGNLTINGILAPGTGTITMRSGTNSGTRTDYTINSSNFTPQGATVGIFDAQGFQDITVDRDITSSGSITMIATRDLTLNSGRTLTTGSAGAFNLAAANSLSSGVGNLTLNGNLVAGTGSLTLVSGANGTRPSWTADATTLTRLGATFGTISITGFNDFTVNRDLNSSGNVTITTVRDLTLNAANTISTSASGALSLQAANGVTSGTGNLNLNGTISAGTGSVTLHSGINGTRPSWTATATNFIRLGATWGAVDIEGFLDTIIDRDITSSSNVTVISFRDLMLNSGRTVTTGSAMGINMQAAAGVIAGTGRFDMNGILSNGTGSLTLISGINGTRPTLTLNSSNLIRQGATFGTISIQGFANAIIDRVLNSSGTVTISNNSAMTIGSDISGTGTLSFNNPLIIEEGTSPTITSTGILTFGSTIDGTAGGVAENLTTNSGTAATVFSGNVGSTTPLGNLTVNADSLTVSANLAGSGTLTLRPVTAGRAVNIGTANADSVTTSFDLSSAETGRFVDGWSGIVIGNLTSGNVTNSRASWSDPVTFLSGNDFTNAVTTSTADTILVQAVRDVILNQSLVTSNATANAIIAAAGRNFVNSVGATALQVGTGGRWLVYSTNPTGTTGEETLSNNFNRYSCTYGGSCPTLGSGNGLLYSYTPLLDVTISPQTYTYGDAVIVPTGYTLQTSGYLNALDTSQGSVGGSGIFATTYVQGNHAGSTFSIVDNGSTFVSNLGYGFHFISPTGTVQQRNITIRANDQNKTYGFGGLGTTGYTLASGSLYNTDTISGVTLTTDASLSTGGQYNYRASPWQITPSAAVFSSGLSSDYTISYASATTGLTIARRALTLASITVANKVYDGLNGATVTGSTFNSAVGGDALTMTGLTATFGNTNVGTRTATVTGGTFGGTDAGNYTFTLGSATGTANITQRTLTITAGSKTMTYGDGNTYNGFSSSGLQNGETIGSVTFGTNATSSTSGNWNYRATPWTITASNATGGTFDINNYSVSYVNGSLTVNRKALTVTASGVDKVYDGLTGATVNYADDRVSGDSFTVSGTAAFGDKNVNTGKTINVTGIGISGTDANNYTANTTASTSADITKRALTITANDKTMTYGGGNTYNGFSSSGLQNSETIGSVTFGTDATSSTSGNWNYRATPWIISVANAAGGTFDINNYSVSYVNGALTVGRKALAVTAAGINKTYDGNADASVNYSDNRITNDVFTVSGIATYGDKIAVNGKPVTVNNIALTGTDANNYTPNSSTTTTADIAKRNLTLASITASDKAYDGLTGATVTGYIFDNAVTGDTLTMTGLTGDFNNKNVGTRTVTVTGGTFGGSDAANYTFTLGSATGTADITKQALTVTAGSKTMTYGDGNSLNGYTSSGLQNGETIGSVTLATNATSSGSGNWNYRATPWTITASNATGGTFDINNYSVNYVDGTLTIGRKALAVTASGLDKTYDGNANASVTYADDRIAGDVFTVSGIATYGDKTADTGKIISVATIGITGADASNYTQNSSTSTSAAILKRNLTLASITASNKTYDGLDTATVTGSTFDNAVSGDDVNMSGLTGIFTNKNAGSRTVMVTGGTFGGTDAANYSFTLGSATGAATIFKRNLTITAADNGMVYGDGNSFNGYTSSGLQNGETIGSLTLSTNATLSGSGNWEARSTPWAIIASNATGGTFDINNYNVSYVNGALSIARKALTIGSITAADRPYNGLTNATISSYSFSGGLAGDAIGMAGLTGQFDGPDVGTHTAVIATGALVGGDASNYSFSLGSASSIANITDATGPVLTMPDTVQYVTQVPPIYVYPMPAPMNDNLPGEVLYFAAPDVSCDTLTGTERDACRARMSI